MNSENRIVVYLLRPSDREGRQLRWHDPTTGRRKTQTIGAMTDEKAEEARADKEYELNHGLAVEPNKMTWERFREVYEEEQMAGRRLATRKKAGYVFDAFERLVNPRTLGKIDERLLSKHQTAMRTEGWKAATIAGHLAYIRAALRWAADQKLIPVAPKVVMPKVPKVPKKGAIRKIVAEQFERLVDVAPDAPWKAFLATAWYTGMRRTEMFDLRWESDGGRPWVDFGESKIWIPAAYNKADADQWLPLHPELTKILAGIRKPSGRMFPLRESPREVSRQFGKLARKAGLKITLHDIRRSFGSRYASAVPAPVLQRLMRHADIKTTLAFYTDVDDKLSEAILKA